MSSPYVGEIRMFGGNFAPAGWAFCSGQLIPISQNDALFNLIGTTYGGDGVNTFALPNLQSRCPMHMGTGPTGQTYVIGEMAGVETVTLTTSSIPSHNHGFLASQGTATDNVPGQNVVPGNSLQVKIYSISSPTAQMNANALSTVGGSQPHDNMMPFLAVNFILSLFGIYPTIA